MLAGFITVRPKLSRMLITWEFPIYTFLIFSSYPLSTWRLSVMEPRVYDEFWVILMSLETLTCTVEVFKLAGHQNHRKSMHIIGNFLSWVSRVSDLLAGEDTWFCISQSTKDKFRWGVHCRMAQMLLSREHILRTTRRTCQSKNTTTKIWPSNLGDNCTHRNYSWTLLPPLVLLVP